MPECHYCGVTTKVQPLDGTPRHTAFNRDHVIPRSWGGRRTVDSCQPCNTGKGATPPTCRCEVCFDAVADWVFRTLSGGGYALTSGMIKRMFDVLRHYLTDGKRQIRQVRWCVTSDGRQSLTLFPVWRGTDVLVWRKGEEPARMDVSTEAGLWDMIEAENRPRRTVYAYPRPRQEAS